MARRTIGGRCKHLRLKKDWTQRQLAENMSTAEANFPWQSIQALEQDRVKQPRYIALLAEVLGTSVNYLYLGLNEAEKSQESTLEIDVLTDVLELIDDIDSSYDLSLDGKQKAKLIIYVYEDAIQKNSIMDKGLIMDLMPLIK